MSGRMSNCDFRYRVAINPKFPQRDLCAVRPGAGVLIMKLLSRDSSNFHNRTLDRRFIPTKSLVGILQFGSDQFSGIFLASARNGSGWYLATDDPGAHDRLGHRLFSFCLLSLEKPQNA